jgi:hypothetical protein
VPGLLAQADISLDPAESNELNDPLHDGQNRRVHGRVGRGGRRPGRRVARLANEPELRERLARLGLERAWELTWERSGAELLSAYAACVGVAGVGGRGGVVVSRRAGSSVRPA